eukprot:TRINITY_DN114508_c0_g1_i1.p1 TRINITY_DN114508_c0_g1~~TRINITY_DN114508_c0_g1_i1.p1  ORF type:complete len:69 (-),score=1.07 TRINITY_DN114508_c0_g1_i1:13-219(-)
MDLNKIFSFLLKLTLLTFVYLIRYPNNEMVPFEYFTKQTTQIFESCKNNDNVDINDYLRDFNMRSEIR